MGMTSPELTVIVFDSPYDWIQLRRYPFNGFSPFMDFQPVEFFQCFTNGFCADEGSDHDPVSFTGFTPPGVQCETKKIQTSGVFVAGNPVQVNYSGLLGMYSQLAFGKAMLYL